MKMKTDQSKFLKPLSESSERSEMHSAAVGSN
jgi:hypothetical protein